MKKLVLYFVLSFLVGCATNQTHDPVVDQKPETIAPPPQVISDWINPNFAWGNTHHDWDVALVDAVVASPILANVQMPCKKFSVTWCAAYAIAKMAEWESSFDPSETYKEDFKDSKGNYVISRGLLQISIESANGYDCQIKDAKQLHDPKINLQCAWKIAERWLVRDGVFFGEKIIDGKKKYLGLGRYWSVARITSSKQAKLIAYLGGL